MPLPATAATVAAALSAQPSAPTQEQLAVLLESLRFGRPSATSPAVLPARPSKRFSTLLTRRLAPAASTSAVPIDAASSLTWLYSASPSPASAALALAILQSPSSDEDIGDSLLEIWGFEGIDLISQAVQRRGEIIRDSQHLSGDGGAQQQAEYEDRREKAASNTQQLPLETRRDYTPQAQVTFQNSAEIAAAKRARKLLRAGKGKGRDNDSGQNDFDLGEWERIREESLAAGPGALWSGKKVRQIELRRRP